MGLSDLGGALTWGETRLLLEAAVVDPATALGAELAGWGYPASHVTLLTLIATIGNEKASRKVMPWASSMRKKSERATAVEVAVAVAELEDGIVFS